MPRRDGPELLPYFTPPASGNFGARRETVFCVPSPAECDTVRNDRQTEMIMTAYCSPFRARLLTLRQVVGESVSAFVRDHHFTFAASMALYGFFALMPLLLLLMIIFSHLFVSSQEAIELLRRLTRDLFPHFTDAILNDIALLSKQRLGGVLSLFLLVWSVSPLAAGLREALFRMFKVESRRSFLTAKLLDIAAVLALLVIFSVGVLTRLAVDFWADYLPGYSPLQPILGGLLPFLFTAVAIALIYRVFAPVRPRPEALWAGAFSATLLLFVLRPIFLAILRFNPEYGFAFGSLKTIFLIIVWVYYSFAMLLLGAEIMAHAHRRDILLLRALFAPGPGLHPALRHHPLLAPYLSVHPPGERLFAENEPGNSMYYILAGSVDLTLRGEPLRTLVAGQYFGEMSLLIHEPRTATARIGPEGAQLIRVTADNWEALLRENTAIVRSLLVEMAQRLKRSNDEVRPTSAGGDREPHPPQ